MKESEESSWHEVYVSSHGAYKETEKNVVMASEAECKTNLTFWK